MLIEGKSGLDCVGETVVLVSPQDNILKAVKDDKTFVQTIDGVISAVVHPTGNHVFAVTTAGMVHLLTFGNENALIEVSLFSCVEEGFDKKVTTIGIHPDGLILGIGRSDGKFGLYDLSTQVLAATFDPIQEGQILCMDFSEKGLHIAAGSDNGKVTVWDLRKQKSIASVGIEGGSNIMCVRFCPTGKYLAFGDANGHISVAVVKEWDTQIALNDDSAKGKVSGLAWGSEAKTFFASYDEDRCVRMWEAI